MLLRGLPTRKNSRLRNCASMRTRFDNFQTLIEFFDTLPLLRPFTPTAEGELSQPKLQFFRIKILTAFHREDIYMTPDDFVRSLTIDGELQPQDCLIDKYRTVKTAEVSYLCSYDVIGRVLTSCVESCHFDVSKNSSFRLQRYSFHKYNFAVE